nr:MAG TPA: hypothetical protein [Bacteriophage sp.]
MISDFAHFLLPDGLICKPTACAHPCTVGFFFGTLRAHPFFEINTRLALTGGLLFYMMIAFIFVSFQV